MVAYPALSSIQQKTLPALHNAPSRIPAHFDDSTHQLWFCETVDGPMMFKLCDHERINSSMFWQGMNTLFYIGFPASLAEIGEVYRQVALFSPLNVPEYVASESASFVLTNWLPGKAITEVLVNDAIVQSLARHISSMHSQKMPTWGKLNNPNLQAYEWNVRLQHTLESLAKNHPVTIPESLMRQALQETESLHIEQFVPVMPDLRWDQFMCEASQLSALVDLDAIVYGPRELEFVLLEYLFDLNQAKLFVAEYQQRHEIPGLSKVRIAYRLLLFLMDVLGERDLDQWMQKPILFEAH